MTKRPLNEDELRSQLNEQLGFLERLANSFDAGYDAEAKLLAAVLRTLLVDSKGMKSLLGQLGLLDQLFIDTAGDFDPQNQLSHGGLVYVTVGGEPSRYMAMLDRAPLGRKIPFEPWWNSVVFADRVGNKLTRCELVRTAAEQDGGVHVDPAIEEIYYRLSRENLMGIFAHENGQVRPLGGPERAAVRQIAHEVLKTFKPEYRKVASENASFIVGHASLVTGDPRAAELPVSSVPIPTKKKIGRNEPCSCGSGKKYKKCCGPTA